MNGNNLGKAGHDMKTAGGKPRAGLKQTLGLGLALAVLPLMPVNSAFGVEKGNPDSSPKPAKTDKSKGRSTPKIEANSDRELPYTDGKIKKAEDFAKEALKAANKALQEAKASDGKKKSETPPLWQTMEPTEFSLGLTEIQIARSQLPYEESPAKKAGETRLKAAETKLSQAREIYQQALALVSPEEQAKREQALREKEDALRPANNQIEQAEALDRKSVV